MVTVSDIDIITDIVCFSLVFTAEGGIATVPPYQSPLDMMTKGGSSGAERDKSADQGHGDLN